ncbi:serine/threonine kinase family protein [Plesiocystis pacifica SIR-1]|uniref:Serine/threonine kinase family protein n=1 Tax=Plesiocystis pacifica SIR-1 TaxID=391625 RepID=A6GG61_9BACT|nr:serine/threonine-protein kinase [Plesiocystis pacifica]EDM75130.1 serine/threonine kinase family protein [Plesiocystis pacifica SIR-1]
MSEQPPSTASAEATSADDSGLEAIDLPEPDSLAMDLARQRVRAQLLGEALQPRRVDRFVLERELGAGGMGMVWSAVDERLDRTIALKFLRRDEGDARSEQRMLVEAQALAKLSHPNVIPVYDAGHSEGRVWIAMEFIPGLTLRQWVAEHDPKPAAILDAWLEVGRGLAAVHRAGLVHRDLKPDNAMLGEDGRARLIDFGLVRKLSAQAPIERDAATLDASASSAQTESVSRREGFAGTPAYAPPEQLAGEPVDARADQYAYCVSVWECLAGARPRHTSAEQQRRIPKRVRRALERGLAPDPRERFPEMEALLLALAPPRRRRWILPAVGLALAGGLGAGLWLGPALEDPPDPCARASAGIDEVWTAARSEQLSALDPRVAGAFESWVEDWRGVAQASCEAVHVENLLPESALAPRHRCLSARRGELELALELIDEEGARGLSRGGQVLGEVELCTREGLDEAPVSAAQREAVDAIERGLLRARWGIGERSIEIRERAAARLHADARELDHGPTIGRAALTRARLARARGDADAAQIWLGEALDEAALSNDLLLRADALAGLFAVALELEMDPERSTWLEGRAAQILAEVPEARVRRAALALDRARLQVLVGEREAARSTLVETVAALEALGPTQDFRRAIALRQLAELESSLGATPSLAGADTLRAQARALELGVEAGRPLGEPGRRAYDDALAAFEAGELAKAEAAMTLAVEELTIEHGSVSPDLANAHVALAAILDAQGRLERGAEHARLADATLRAIDPRHPDLIYALSALGTLAFRSEDFAEAEASFRRARLVGEGHLPPDSVELADLDANLGEALHALGRTAEADARLRRALAVLEAELGPDSPQLAIARKALGAVCLESGALDEAHASLRFAVRLSPEGSREQLEARWLLAQVLVEQGDREAGVREADAALAGLSSMDDGARWEREIRAWQAALRPPSSTDDDREENR